MDFDKELFTYVKSLNQLIFINTKETERATNSLINIIQEFNRNEISKYNIPEVIKINGMSIYTWDMIKGLTNYNELIIDKKTCDIINALEIINTDKYLAGFYIFKYSDISINTKYNNSGRIPYFFHLLNKYKQTLQEQLKWIIFIGDISMIPEELKNLFVLIDFELPNIDDIKQCIHSLIEGEEIENMSEKDISEIAEACKGMTLYEIENIIKINLVKNNYKYLDINKIFKEKANIVKKSNLLEFIDTNLDLSNVGGLSILKNEVKKISKIYEDINKALKFGMKMPKGYLLIGIAGTGKTLISKAIAKELKLPLYRAEIGALFGSLVGETERNTRELFKLIKAVSPAIIQIDEIEKVFSGSGNSGASDGGVTDRLVGSFLTYMQERDYPCFFIATCNDINSLPAPFVRKGRWDEIFFIDIPNKKERKEILKIKISETGRNPNKFDLDILSLKSENLTGAEIEIAIQEALKTAFYENRDITQKDLENILSNTKGIAMLKSNEIEFIRNWAIDKAKFANAEEKEIITVVTKPKKTLQ